MDLVKLSKVWEVVIPEIIEVDRLRADVFYHWKGRFIEDIIPCGDIRMLETTNKSLKEFTEEVRDIVVDVTRRGKYLGVHLKTGKLWLIHFNSTGWLFPTIENTSVWKRDFLHSTGLGSWKLHLKLSGGDFRTWTFADSSMRSKWYLTYPGDIPVWDRLGPDWILDPNGAAANLRKLSSRRSVLSVLTDQSISTGLGLYLVNEISFLAGVHPDSEWSSIPEAKRLSLIESIDAYLYRAYILNYGIKEWAVFKKKGKPCPICRRSIEYTKSTVGLRGLYYCPNCQPQY